MRAEADNMRTVLADDQIATLKDILGSFVAAFNDKVRNPLVPDDTADHAGPRSQISKPKSRSSKKAVQPK